MVNSATGKPFVAVSATGRLDIDISKKKRIGAMIDLQARVKTTWHGGTRTCKGRLGGRMVLLLKGEPHDITDVCILSAMPSGEERARIEENTNNKLRTIFQNAWPANRDIDSSSISEREGSKKE